MSSGWFRRMRLEPSQVRACTKATMLENVRSVPDRCDLDSSVAATVPTPREGCARQAPAGVSAQKSGNRRTADGKRSSRSWAKRPVRARQTAHPCIRGADSGGSVPSGPSRVNTRKPPEHEVEHPRPSGCIERAKCHGRIIRIRRVDEECSLVEWDRLGLAVRLLDNETAPAGRDFDPFVRPCIEAGEPHELSGGTRRALEAQRRHVDPEQRFHQIGEERAVHRAPSVAIRHQHNGASVLRNYAQQRSLAIHETVPPPHLTIGPVEVGPPETPRIKPAVYRNLRVHRTQRRERPMVEVHRGESKEIGDSRDDAGTGRSVCAGDQWLYRHRTVERYLVPRHPWLRTGA